jgi:translation elongation factor EF-4
MPRKPQRSVSRGYASFEYEFKRFEEAALVKLDVMINGDKVDALSVIVHKDLSQVIMPVTTVAENKKNAKSKSINYLTYDPLLTCRTAKKAS